MKLVDAGKVNDQLVRFIAGNSRQPTETTGDLYALIAGVNVGSKRVDDLIDKYGLGTVEDTVEELLEYTERIVRLEIARIPDGVYEGECWVDDDGIDLDRSYRICTKITVKGDDLEIDFTAGL